MKLKYVILFGILVFSLLPNVSAEEIGINENFNFANVPQIQSYNEAIEYVYISNSFYAYPNDTILLWVIQAQTSNGQLPTNSYEVTDGTVYLITTENLHNLRWNLPHEKTAISYVPRTNTLYSVNVSQEGLYVVYTQTNYTGSNRYYGSMVADVHLISSRDASNNAYYQTYNDYITNEENTYNQNYWNIPPFAIAMALGGIVCLVILNIALLRIRKR